MPINFELTFTQPFLAQLDTGQPRGSADMAKFITNNYVRTMLTGIPGGGTVPPALPAPALGSPPPPFPIPALPINAFANRQRAMQRILQTYFEAREMLIMQGSIKGTIQSIFLLLKKYNTLRQQINQLRLDVVDLRRQVEEIPRVLQEIKNAIIDIVTTELQKLDSLFVGLQEFEIQLTAPQYQLMFAEELRIIDKIRNFKITANIASYNVIDDILNYVTRKLQSIPDIEDGSQVDMFKKQFYQQIRSVVSTVVTIAGAITKPENFIGYIRDLANVDQKFKPLLDILYRYRFLRVKLEPKIVKLKRKIQEALFKLETKIQARIAEEKKKLKEKLKARAEKRAGSGKKSIYLKAGKIITEYKQRYLKKIKIIRTTISDIRGVVASTQRLIRNASEFGKDLESFMMDGLFEYIEKTRSDVLDSVQARNSAGYIEQQVTRLYQSMGIASPVILNGMKKLLVGKVTSPTVLYEYLESKPIEAVSLLERFKSLLADLENVVNAVNKLTKGKADPQSKRLQDSLNQKEPTVGTVMSVTLRELQNQLTKIQQKMIDFVNKQREKLNKTLNRIKEDAKMKLLMLVPIKSDLKDGKTKAEIIKAKRDKVRDVKNKVKVIIKKVNIVKNKIIPGATFLAKNLQAGNWRYSTNESALNKFIDGIYDFKILNCTTSSERYAVNDNRNRLKDDIMSYFFGFELLYDLMLRLSEEMASSDFLEAFGNKLKQRTVGTIEQGYVDLYNKIKAIPSLRRAKLDQVINFFSDTQSVRALRKSYIRTILSDCEKQYFTETRAFFQQFGNNPLLKKMFPKINFTIDIMIITLFEGIDKLANGVKTILEGLYKKTVKPLVDSIKDKLKRVIADKEAWLKEHVAKRAFNLDAKLMSLAFNLATRAFWTAFSWTMPNGVRYTCGSIGPFLPLITKPDEGASALVRELSRNLNLQLTAMVGVVTPPPATGIPPFPFAGYR